MSKKKHHELIMYDLSKLIFLLLIGGLFLFPDYRFYFIIGFSLFVIIPIIYRSVRELALTKKLQKSGINDIDSMNGFQFEQYLKALYLGLNYKPKVTKSTYDFGADLILDGAKSIVIQAKCYGPKSLVGIDAIQQVYAAKAYYKADEAWVVTNRSFIRSATLLAESCKVSLIDREKLIELILSIQDKHIQIELPFDTDDSLSFVCKKCGSPLTKRTGKNGAFYGCNSFPGCRHTEALS